MQKLNQTRQVNSALTAEPHAHLQPMSSPSRASFLALFPILRPLGLYPRNPSPLRRQHCHPLHPILMSRAQVIELRSTGMGLCVPPIDVDLLDRNAWAFGSFEVLAVLQGAADGAPAGVDLPISHTHGCEL